jgi:hypothetical protein
MDIEDGIGLDLSLLHLDLEEFEMLSKGLNNFSSLKYLQLNLEETNLDDGRLDKIANALSRYEFVEHIKLNISGNSISLEVLEFVIKKLARLPMMKELEVDVRRIKSVVGKKQLIDDLFDSLELKTKVLII